MTVAVIVLADHDARWLHPFVERIAANYLAVRHKLLILLAVEQGAEIIVQPAATIMALVYDYSVSVSVLVAQQFAVNGAETLRIHRLNVNISDASARNAVNESAVAVYPSLVEQVVEFALRDSLHRNLHLLALGVSDAEAYILANLSVEQWEVVHSGFNLLAVDALDDAAGCNARILHIERTTLDNLLNLQTVALILRVEEYSQVGGGKRAVRSVVAGSCMRSVQLAKHFAQHLLEVEIVVDVRQELLIGFAVTFPVNTMNLRVVELVFHLSPYVVEEILALLGWLIVEVSLEADVLGAESAQIHLLDAASVADEEVLQIGRASCRERV